MPPLFFQLVLPNDTVTKAMRPILEQVQNHWKYHRPVTGGILPIDNPIVNSSMQTCRCSDTADISVVSSDDPQIGIAIFALQRQFRRSSPSLVAIVRLGATDPGASRELGECPRPG